MRIITWNINGWNAMSKKPDMFEMVEKYDPDIICLQEIKLNKSKKLRIDIDGYASFEHIGDKPGYSGTAILYKSGMTDLELSKEEIEGRICILKTKLFTLVNVYTPNSGENLDRLQFRVEDWDGRFTKLLKQQETPHLIVVGDLNVARTENDIANPKSNIRNAGFTTFECNSFEEILRDTKLTDTWREQHPDETKGYTYWSYRGRARERNTGWRIDYVLSNKPKKIKNTTIMKDVHGSDHAPVMFDI